MVTNLPHAEVSDNAGQNRFELRLNGDLVGILGYFDTDRPSGVPGRHHPVVDFLHTVIVEDFGHQGLAGILVGRSLDIARRRGWKVRPVCTYVQRFLDTNPEYRDVIVPLEPVRRRA
ncbi:GNAT family N-acetyltransferase [Rhodococcus phenolicus]|uniref:GNAT family N-acetyltransferase n=1 Tax=Rhodococcus phenolicus TaxID=263849 RepID=UPI000836DF15|nr:GNAT family N-acetyltransferase [Rhodococcus phenolicus]